MSRFGRRTQAACSTQPRRRRVDQSPCAGWRSGNGDAATGGESRWKLEWQRNDSGLCPGNGLNLLAAPGSKTENLEVPGLSKGAIWYPEFLPAGDALLFLWLPEDGTGNEIYLASFKAGKLVDPVPLLKNETAGKYTPAGGGRILFVRNDNLYSQKLDLGQRKLVGDSQLIEEHVGSEPGMNVDRRGLLRFAFRSIGLETWDRGALTGHGV